MTSIFEVSVITTPMEVNVIQDWMNDWAKCAAGQEPQKQLIHSPSFLSK